MNAAVSDEELMRQFIATGSSDAFGELVERHKDGVVRFAARMLGDYHRAEEAAQETFIKVLTRKATFDPGQSVRPWIFSIAGNICRNELRRRREVPMDDVPEPLAPVQKAQDGNDVERAFRWLAPEEQEALLLREFHGFSYQEIAAAMDAPLNSVKSWIRRGRMRLAELLDEGNREERR